MSLEWGEQRLRDVEAAWKLAGGVLEVESARARLYDEGEIRGGATVDLAAGALPRVDLEIRRLDVHRALANLAPDKVDAEGAASGRVRLAMPGSGAIEGRVDLAFDGPGTLRIGDVPELERLLVGNFGLDLASLAMRDLRQYPFREGRLSLESAGRNTELEIHFERAPRTGREAVEPRKEIVNGQEMWVGSLVVPKIDLEIPITGTSLGEILTLAAGFRPGVPAASEPPKRGEP